jgi:radical SAM superfamily enzyme YgiQ (UPF0313 family)
MHALLMKCHGKTLLARWKPIVTEPLELERIAAVLNGFTKMGLTYRIYDSMMAGGRPERVLRSERPELLMLSGYITAVPEILRLARLAKQLKPETVVWVGGVHGEGCPEDFYDPAVDAIFYGDGISAMKALLDHLLMHSISFDEQYENVPGLIYKGPEGKWLRTPPRPGTASELPRPDRKYFEKYRHRTRYLSHKPVALLKTTLSCPYTCDFCYCKLLNQGKYSEQPVEAIMEEISEIDCETLWIVDDCFLTTPERAQLWIEVLERLKAKGIRKNFVAYARADAIVRLEAYIRRLKSLGFGEWIVGLEAVDDVKLREMGKSLREEDNARAVAVLREAGVALTALFLVSPDDDRAAFARLRKWIRAHGVRRYTVSILTPLKGTALYEAYESRITDRRFEHYDFLHLVIKPTQMPAWLFYLRFWRLSLGARLK